MASERRWGWVPATFRRGRMPRKICWGWLPAAFCGETWGFLPATLSVSLGTPLLPHSTPSCHVGAGMEDHMKKGLKAHINDLPDDCLISIICRLDDRCSLPIRRNTEEGMTVQSPLQCALVCKRWRALADAAICCLRMADSDLTERLVQDLGLRFKHLTTLALANVIIHDDTLVALARSTPHLEHLEMKGVSASRPVMAPALTSWKKLCLLNLGNHLCPPTSEDVTCTLDALSKLQSLQHLSLRYFGSDLERVCEGLDKMTGLTRLDIACPSFPPLPSPHISQILSDLDLCDFDGSELPDSLGLLSNLNVLCVDGAMYLTALPESLGSLSRLTRLEIRSCISLTALPEALGRLRALKELSLVGCPALISLPPSLGSLSCSLTKLQILSCGALSVLSDGLGHLSVLEKLEIVRCDCLITLPETLGELRALRDLLIINCASLCSLPQSLGSLSGLRCLYLKRLPQLTKLPETIWTLSSLQLIFLKECRGLGPLPECMWRWKDLFVVL